ncbi:MAG: hypothetical protein IPI48_06565 [bacterium]|nr:hypothetical protein [bacterium]
MCLFTHFAAGALAGGLTGSPLWGAVAGVASHAVLDVLPHYDHPDWRLELGGGIAALALLLAMPFASWAAVIGGIAGMLPDLENLFQKLGKMRRDQFVYPTHTGLLKHGRPLGPRNLAVQAAIFVACFAVLGLARPGDAAAAAEPGVLESGPEAVMAAPVARVVSQTAARTVVRIDMPVTQEPGDWQRVGPELVRFALPPITDDLRGEGAKRRDSAPEFTFTLAVPTRNRIEATVTDVRWWREPAAGWSAESVISVAMPAIFRGVPLAGCSVPLYQGDGILAGLTVEFSHPAGPGYEISADRNATFDADSSALRGLDVPASVANRQLFETIARRAQAPRQVRAAAKAAPFDPFATTGNWVKLGIPATGLYRLTGQQLSGYGVPVAGVDPAKLRLYRGGGMALELDPEFPDSLQVERTRLNEVAISVVGGSDGEWNLDDEIRFYGVATSAWKDRFVAGAGALEHYDHPYADEAVYWLTWENDATASPLPGSPRRVPQVAALPFGVQEVSAARLRLHMEQQFADVPGVFEDNWGWDTSIFSSRTELFNVRTPLPDSAATFVIDVRGLFYVGSGNGFVYGASGWLNGDQGNKATTTFSYFAQNDSMRVRIVGQSDALVAGGNTITIENSSVQVGTARALGLDSFDIAYWTGLNLTAGFGQLDFAHWRDQVTAPDSPVDLVLNTGGTAPAVVWDVSQPDSVVALSGQELAGFIKLGVVRQPDSDRHFVASRVSDLLPVASGTRVQANSLLDDTGDVDYVVVAAAPFTQAAQELAEFRSRSLPGVASPSARAVSAESIYDNFSGGQKDPVAIRNYLRQVYDLGAQRLSHVCLLGRASRDYRNYKDRTALVDLYDLLPTFVRNYYPAFPVGETLVMPFASDDGFVSFDSPPPVTFGSADLDFPDVACGRLPAMNVAEAREMVARAIAYADAPEPGAWRNHVLMTADDVRRPSSPNGPAPGENAHTAEAELLSRSYIPEGLDIGKIYGVDYPFPPASQVKPAARAAINDALNAGTTVFYYVGHGAEDNLADEQIFQSRDIANLRNGMKRPLFLAFSCDVGVYDSPNRRSMAEQFLQYDSGGAIGAICASQLSFSGYNNLIGNAYFANQFPGRHIDAEQTAGRALILGKAEMSYQQARVNSQRYNLMGDPALKLPHPVDDLTLSEVSVDTLRAGVRQAVVLGGSGKALLGAGDTYRLRVQDSDIDKSYPISTAVPPAEPTMRSWVEAGAPIFAGEGTMGTGDLVIPFKVPSQIRYGERGRVRLVIETPDGDHVAVETLPAVRGSTGAVDDVRGPLIGLAFEGGRYRVRPGDALTATLTDTSGIAILGTSPGNSLLLELDNTGRMTNVTGSFSYAPDSYTSGSLVFPLPADLAAGTHRAALHASDALGNVGSDTLSFVIVPSGVAGIEDITLFPNPTPGPCRLLFELSDPMAVQWDIYTLAGNRIRTLREEFSEAGPRILEWDGRDTQGDDIANGTYLFVLRGTGASADGREITKTGKLVIMR